MTMQETIARINELYHTSKERALTEAEKAEQAQLRRRYIDSVTGNLRAELSSTSVKYPDGRVVKLTEKKKK